MPSYFGSSKVLDRYSAVLVHQLNNDLTLIQGSASILQDALGKEASAKADKSLERILMATQRAAAMLKGQRNLLKDPGEGSDPVPVSELLEDLVSFLAPFSKEAGITVQAFQEDAHAMIPARFYSAELLGRMVEGLFWVWDEAAQAKASELQIRFIGPSPTLRISTAVSKSVTQVSGQEDWMKGLSAFGKASVFYSPELGWELQFHSGK
ncbi:MAG: HAMP domain-containing histidine kinase [Bdellovibrionales bacterium]|nr:HAMP domain-containing histidine kinase [Bdellovibrionales bacterium]